MKENDSEFIEDKFRIFNKLGKYYSQAYNF